MQTFGLTRIQLLKIILVILSVLMVLSRALAAEFRETDKVVSRDGPNRGVSYVNFVEEKFFYLNITALGGDFVDNMPECSFACLDTPSCFSFNLGATRDINDRFPCELLPSDKYNNSDKFVHSNIFHHFSIATPCSTWPCTNKGKCLPLYKENHYKCLCTKGFKGKNCENDIDECSSANECHLDAICTNTKGSYNCTCQLGFVGDGKNCSDIDECSIENECHQNATCNNTKGSYNCTCKDGFEGDGRNCADIDECSILNDCHLDATCNNTEGSYNCTCKDGFEGDGKNCFDIDECSIENECHQNATCNNTKGSYNCTCKDGFEGDGRNCAAPPECKNYIALNAWDRNVHSTRGTKCDDNLKTGWYRFQGQAGRQLPTICPPVQRCNTDLPGWMNGNHPNVEDGIVKRQVCFHGYSNCCYTATTIDVRNCGAYFVYRLTKVSFCNLRYCGTG
ncbi:uromodulin-like isoform X1 [Acropora muricata]|uniref:uromodulin-like isoform X1 n=1 Tax=Acropora muricata TaxID=159855 RepID=UPI0034E46B10